MAWVIINMGSNLGNRALMLSSAMRRVAMEFGQFEISHAVESDAQGYESEHKFLNIAMAFATDDEPQTVLEKLQAIESELCHESHRNPDGTYADRSLDIDIVCIDDKVISTPSLQVPHPRLTERRFFLEPLREIAPAWRHPVNGMTADEMLAQLPGGNGSTATKD